MNARFLCNGLDVKSTTAMQLERVQRSGNNEEEENDARSSTGLQRSLFFTKFAMVSRRT